MLPTLSAGQGNRRSSATVLGSTSTYLQLQALYRNSRQWNQAYRNSPKSACSKSSSKSGSKAANLCAGSADTNEQLSQSIQLLLATSPRVYSSNDTQQTGGLQLFSPPGNQEPCQTCTAFAVAAAAETAMATTLGVDVSQCSISVQALFFCATPISRSCDSGWTLPAALEELQRRGSSLPTAACLPYKPPRLFQDDSSSLCAGSCAAGTPFARQGSFSFVQVASAWAAQRHIRQHGAVLTQFDLYPGFEAFFRNASNAKAVYRPPPGAVPQENHAVLLVGYDNDRQFWLARNSWGVDWGDGGLFRVAFDSCAVLTPDSEAYGVIWTPTLVPDAVKLPVMPAPQHSGCYWYKARPGDYLSRVAWLAGVPLEQFMLDNTAVVKDLDAPITGLQLLLCKPNPDNIIDATKPVDKQLQSLLRIKSFIDTTGVLQDWSEENGADGGYCEWKGVACAGTVVAAIVLWSDTRTYSGLLKSITAISGLQGVLPPASAFDGLPELRYVAMAQHPGIGGTLPSDWSRLQQLETMLVDASLTGTLPPSWAELKRLRVLYLAGNMLQGALPDAWSGMAALEELGLHANALTGSLPPSWGQLKRLRELRAHMNKLQGPLPDSFKALTSLEDLRLHSNALTSTLPPSWGQMRALKTLYLHNNTLGGGLPDAWSGMAALEELGLHINALTGSLPPSWGQLKRLREFWAFRNKLRGPLPDSFKALTGLEDLQLSNNIFITGTLPPSWSQMRALKTLYLHNNTLRGPLPAAWSGMAALEELGLHTNALTGSLPPSWGQLRRLREFWAFRNKLRGPLPDSFKALTGLEDLQLSNNIFITGTLPPSWSQMRALKILYLHNNTLRGPLPAAWSGMTALQELDVESNTLDGSLPPSWSEMKSLQQLRLSQNVLTGSLPPVWSRLTKLRYLVAYSDKLRGPLPDEFKSLTNLEVLSLSNNGVSGVVPPSWKSMTRLKEVYLWNNTQLHGCLPTSWQQQMLGFQWQANVYKRTNITGFCDG